MPDSRIDKASVAVVVPIYKAEINADEAKSLESICRVLAARDIIVVKPRGLDLSALLAPYPGIRQIEFDPSFFQGIRGYNRLMTSAAFYDTFAAYQYILIAQLDTYIFRDDLDTWCARGFDYVGAPWLRRTVNRFPPMLWIKRIEDALRRRKGLYSKTALYNRVGNGGLSLRKTASPCPRMPRESRRARPPQRHRPQGASRRCVLGHRRAGILLPHGQGGPHVCLRQISGLVLPPHRPAAAYGLPRLVIAQDAPLLVENILTHKIGDPSGPPILYAGEKCAKTHGSCVCKSHFIF